MGQPRRFRRPKYTREAEDGVIWFETIPPGQRSYRVLHLHKYYRETFGYRSEDFPHASDYSERALSLPLSAKLTDRDVEDVITILLEVLNTHRR